ncbi:MAG: endopeptidase La [Candidatus Marinimicrobia bacterium]|nr:endopeptidase La [Candidatus Neomarinimicrobiota bacterium]
MKNFKPVELDKKILDAYNKPKEIPVMPLRNTVLFPQQIIPLYIGRDHSLRLLKDIINEERIFVTVAQKDIAVENPGEKDLYKYGTLTKIIKVFEMPDNSRSVIVQGLERVQIHAITKKEPYYHGIVERINENYEETIESVAIREKLKEYFKEIVELSDYLSKDNITIMMNAADEGNLADVVISMLNISVEEKQHILEQSDINKRLSETSVILHREIQKAKIGEKIMSDVKDSINKNQREYYLREQMKAIRKELGEDEDERVMDLKKKLDEAEMPEEARKAADRELERLTRMSKQSPEYNVSLTYLELMAELPWSVSTDDEIDLKNASKILEEDHYGLHKIKLRILEYLAVRKLKVENDPKSAVKGPILCFVGPPGTGKTSVAKSIARAMGRNAHRMSLGGVRDEAEIRGHRRTYIGALPGRIVQGIKKAGSNNPIFILDEIDKLGADYKGDPSSALLEVLDPEQNYSFSDHYLETSFDLSNVMFIATGNWAETIPGPLLDRMELIEFTGYIMPEKTHIAKKFLIPKQVKEHGLSTKDILFTEDGIRRIIQDYTREAGVRHLEREIANVCRKVAKEKVENKKFRKRTISDKQVEKYLGKQKYYSDRAERMKRAGIAIGLAWTQAGGDILFIEATKMPGEGKLQLTGQLGDVMKESAKAVLSYIRSNSKELGIDERFDKKYDIHIHVPAGAVPKDGPSAGVTLLCAAVSVLSGRKVKNDLAMSGEITLRGSVLPVGGVEEKVIAAHRAGLKTIILPHQNKKDLDDIPEEILEGLSFHFVKDMSKVLETALEKKQ